MKIITWNCRGLARPAARRMLRDLLHSYKPDVIFLCEVKTTHTDKISAILRNSNLCFYDFVPAFNKAGGLCLAWTPSVSVNIVLKYPWLINALIFLNVDPRPWQFTGVHCPAVTSLKPSFWQSLNDIFNSFDGPWLVMGDFNDVLSQVEKKGGKPFASASRNALGDELNFCNLIDLGFSGYRFTWSNKRPGMANIQSRLDRGVANAEWCLLYPKAHILHLPPTASDHCPLLLETHPNYANRSRPFLFEEMWFRDFSCETLIADVCLSPVAGCPILRLHNLLKSLRIELRKWNRRTFGWCQDNINRIKQSLNDLQPLDQTSEVLAMQENLQCELDEQLLRLETKWRQKAKQMWLKDGDANTKFFHLTAILQSKANFIHSIKTRDNNVATDWEHIGNEFSIYFRSLFKSELDQSQPLPIEHISELMRCVISEEENSEICALPTTEEIKGVVFNMASFKSPGPDGFPPCFFKKYWHIVGKHLNEAVRHFFLSGQLPPAINHTYITLIPKSLKADTVENFRPISLCNTTYKVISKILANRLKPLLDKFISPLQMAFVPSRTINENSILSHEIMHYLHRKKGKKGFMAIKIDLTKAYDRVEWPLLIQILKSIGLCDRFVTWVSQCISSPSFSLLINGRLPQRRH
ncbi:UNVERIFIED_CONTAM: hypothetical protein Sradi_5676200 [Sesamum radiatum]|uniref:Reverse transcriptase domain-containing protein n=1 Tax=Sesamum radiatum TaxID=300843 RepID=A0AAW2L1T8_SESRA